MASPPNKPGTPDGDGTADDQAVENQGNVTPDDYPKGSNGKPEDEDHGTA